MKLYKKILVLCCIISLMVSPIKVIAEPIEITPLILSTKEQVAYFSKLYGGNTEIALKVMECESDGNHSSVGDLGHSKGIYQFQKETFSRMSKILGEELNYSSKYDQIKLASFALSKQELAREWTSYRAIMNGGKYSFYSRQLGKHFTVYCKL